MEKNGLTKLAVRCYYVRNDIVCYLLRTNEALTMHELFGCLCG